MNALSAAALSAVAALSIPLAAQEPRTGVSNPPPVAVDNSAPSANDAGVIPGYQPTPAPLQVRRSLTAEPAPAASAGPVEEMAPRAAGNEQSRVDVDAGIVASIPHLPGELPAGTMFRVKMNETLSTATTQDGAPFSAELIQPVEQDGRILLPTGTRLEGRVTEVRGGHRIKGPAALHLDARRLILPDGTQHLVHAQVIDTDQNFATRIDSEGTIVRRDHIKTELAVLGAATGVATVAGAMVGGGVGAVVGASLGAGLSTAWWLKQDRQTVLPSETAVVFSLNEPMMLGNGGR